MRLERREKQCNLYTSLQKESIRLLHQLCGERWSDFNAHDPGVTLSEITNYALYELDYQLGLPFGAYAQIAGSNTSGLPTARTLSIPTLTSPEDYEQLIFTKLKEVSRCQVTYTPEGYYEIAVTVIPGTDYAKLETAIYSLYHSHRNLCELAGQIKITGEAPREAVSFPTPFIPFESGTEEQHHPAPITDFYRLRNHLPDCYRINNYYISSTQAETYRQYQQRQLDGYLLIFDYLLAHTRQQAHYARTLFNLSVNLPTPPLPAIEYEPASELIDREKKENSQLTYDTFSDRQRSRYLDLLDTICGEKSRKYYEGKKPPVRNQLRASLITRYPEINQQRFRSFNVLNCHEHGAGAYEILCRLAGLCTTGVNRLCNIFSRYHFQLKEDTTFFTGLCYATCFTGPYSLKHSIPVQDVCYRDELYESLYQQIRFLRDGNLYESFLVYGDNLRNYSFVCTEKKKYLLLFNVPGQQLVLTLSSFTDTAQLVRITNLFCSFIRHLRSISSTLIMIEHMLLESIPEGSYRLSLILPRWSKGACKPEKLRQLVVKRFPAHLEIQILWLKEKEFTTFEEIYLKWRRALAMQDPGMIRHTSTLLSALLARWPLKTCNDYAYNW